MNQKVTDKLTFFEKLGYGFGDAASNFVFQMVLAFFPFFYTDVFIIPPAMVGLIFLSTRILDAFFDFSIGMIADRTNTRWGRFRPYLLWFALPMGISAILSMTTPDWGTSAKVYWAFGTYFVMMLVYSCINIPYSSLLGVLTSSSIERTKASSFRFGSAFAVGIIVGTFTIPIINSTGSDNDTIVTAKLTDKTITIDEKGRGLAKIVVTADDGSEKKNALFAYFAPDITTTQFRVNVKSIVADAGIAEQRLDKGFGAQKISLTGVFKTTVPGPITYTVESNDSSIVSAAIEGNDVVIKEHKLGRAHITIIATNAREDYTSTSFDVIINTPQNPVPVATRSLENLELSEKFARKEISIDGLFTDNNPLTITAKSSNGSVAEASIINGKLVIAEVGSGVTKVTVTADDKIGGVAEQSFFVTLKKNDGNRPFIISEIKNIDMLEGSENKTIDLSAAFVDAEHSDIKYTIQVVDERSGFQSTMTIYGIITILLFFLTFTFTKERVKAPVKKTEEKGMFFKDLKLLITCRPWVVLFFIGLFTISWVAIRLMSGIYYFKYYVMDETQFGIFMLAGNAAMIVGSFTAGFFARLLGKRRLYISFMIVQSILLGAFFLVGPNQFALMYTLHIVSAFLSGPTNPLLFSMYADSADYIEYKSGRRIDGLVFSAASLAQKFGWAVGGFLSASILVWFHYVPNEIQSDFTLTGIRIMMSVIPATGCLLTVASLLFYNLTDKRVQEMEKELVARRGVIEKE